MNYLSHYFLDAESGKPYHNFGLVFPDMLGASIRGWKPDFSKTAFELAQHLHLVEGIRKHHDADSLFHSSSFFTHHSQAIRKIFEASGFVQPGTRLFFVAHIFLEFMLDRIIMQQHGNLAKHFYEDIDMVEEQLLLPFFAHTNTEPKGFLNFLHNFRKHQYLYAYADTNGLFYSLNRTLQRARQQPFPEALLQQSFKEVIHQVEEILKPVYENYFTEMKQNSK